MKKSILFAAFFALFALAVSASAQDSKSKCGAFAGTWKSTDLGAMAARLKSQTLTITCDGDTLKIATVNEANETAGGGGGAGAGGGGGARPGGGGGGFGGPQEYKLDGKDVVAERQTQNG